MRKLGIIKWGKIRFWYILILIPIVQKGKKFVTFAIRLRTIWYDREKVSNFEIAGVKIERNVAKHQICHTLPERSVGTS